MNEPWWETDRREAFEAGFAARGVYQEDAEFTPEEINADYQEWLSTQRELGPIEDLNLPVRLYNAFRREGIHTVRDARKSLSTTVDSLDDEVPFAGDIRNVGWRTVEAGRAALEYFDRQHEK